MARRAPKKNKRPGLALILTLMIAFGSLAAVISTDTTPRLGLDLEGGISVTLTATGPNLNEEGVLEKSVEIIRQRIDDLGVAEPEINVAEGGNIFIQLPGVEDEQKALELIGTTAQLTFRQVEDVIGPEVPERQRPEVTDETGPEVDNEEVVYPSAQPGETNVLYRLKAAELTGEVVTKAEAVVDQNGVNWAVSIDMDDQGADVWAKFTSELACLRDEGEQVRQQVAIVLDGEVQSAAGMRSPQEAGTGGGVECGVGIDGGQTQIDVGDEAEAKQLALVLRYGALPITLEQSEVSKVSATLGADSLQAGIRAGLIGLALVMIYMVVYYRALGLVVWLGLAVFSSAIYTLMAVLGETAGLSLSLAGVAGVIVSVGVTCDSYIVSFERLKDEAHQGRSVRAAADRGMQRALRTILVADFVTGAAAVILFFLAVGSVRGFALTLGLATIIDLLVAFFFTRSAVTLLARSKRFTEGRYLGINKALGIAAAAPAGGSSP